jgi:diguanylate cyclase (GGDEF)-like protein
MRKAIKALAHRLGKDIRPAAILAMFPIFCLIAYFIGGEPALIGVSLGLAVAVALAHRTTATISRTGSDYVTKLPLQADLIQSIDRILLQAPKTGRTTACLVIAIDDFPALEQKLGLEACRDILAMAAQRLKLTLRDHDIVARLDGPSFGIALTATPQADLESLIEISARIQSALAEPHMVDAHSVYTTASVGFCLPSRSPSKTGIAFLEGAQAALHEACSSGAGSIRAFTANTSRGNKARNAIQIEAGDALENGDIIPWFQPQICTDTGNISGMEALARWIHPQQGVIPPADFLPVLEDSNLMERLGEIILYHALTALKAWDNEGFNVPRVSVNFSAAELSNPKLIDKIKWELDRFELHPSRLIIEVLENVIASSDNDTITRNISRLSELGCGIDLDDFGTGHASIANMRRFAVNRIKIDRSYVTHCDSDRGQQDMLAAILVMADRLQIDTIAEGIETAGEHGMLSQLGCKNVQGYLISRPISFEKSCNWMTSHRAQQVHPPSINQRAG